MDRTASSREFWLHQAKLVSRKINLAWWLETMAAPLLLSSIIAAVSLLLLRRQYPGLSPFWLAGSIGAGFALLALLCRVRASRRFESAAQSLVRLEAAMHLHNGLSAAEAGLAPWPSPAKPAWGLSWHWPRLAVPLAGALALLAAGLLLPVSAPSARTAAPSEQPQSWQQLDAQLDLLAKEEVIEEDYLEEMRQKLDELRAQKEEQWFSHSSLEATDTLKQAHQAELGRVSEELQRAGNALTALENEAGRMGEEQRNRLLQEFDQALTGLQNGAMKPNPQLLEQMKQLDPKQLGQLSQEQLQQLRDNLQKHQQAMKQAQGKGSGGDWEDELLSDEEGEGNGQEGHDGEGNGPGRGGVARGPGHAPGVLGKEREALASGAPMHLEAKDLSRALPGDLLQLQDGEHEVDSSPTRLRQGGAIQATGQGGDRVWRDALHPEEQRSLKKFFE